MRQVFWLRVPKLAALRFVLFCARVVAGFLLVSPAAAQLPVFDFSISPRTVVATGSSEVLGGVRLSAAALCGTNADGLCVSTAGTISILYAGVPIDNSLASGILISETIGGVTTAAPNTGTLISGLVTISNLPQGGVITIGLRGGVDVAAGDSIVVDGVRGQIVSSPASAPGAAIVAQPSSQGGSVGFQLPGQTTVSTSATGLIFLSAAPSPGAGSSVAIQVTEGFRAAFVQHVATPTSALPTNPRPAFGATNNSQVRFTATGLAGRVEWPASVPSQLAGGRGISGGGSELQLISQTFDGREAIYQFATADQRLSDLNTEVFSVMPHVCGSGTVSIQAQLFSVAGARPGFNDPLAPASPATLVPNAMTCDPVPLSIVSGDNQRNTMSMPLPQPLVVRVRDANANPVAGVVVRFAAATGGGSVSATSVNTDAQGLAQTSATLGSNLGTQTFSASVGALSVTFTATALAIPVPPLPNLRVIPHVVKGGGFLNRITVVNLTAQSNAMQANFLSQAGEVVGSVARVLAPNGRLDISSTEAERDQALTVRWVLIGSQFEAAASVFQDVRLPGANNTLTAFESGAVEPLPTFTLPIFRSAAQAGSLTTGLALANPSTTALNVAISLADSAGFVRAADNVTLPAFGQSSFVLSDRASLRNFLQSQQNFSGSVVVQASAPVAGLAVGNEAGQLFSIPLAGPAGCFVSPFAAVKTSFVPHVAVGTGWASRIAVTNLCQVANHIRVDALDPSGAMAQVFPSVPAALVPGGSVELATPDAQRFGPLVVRWMRVTTDVGVAVHTLLDVQSAAAGTLLSAVGAGQNVVSTRFVLPVEFTFVSGNAEVNAGLAVANGSSSTNDIVLELVDAQGNVVARDTSVHLGPLGQSAFLLTQLPSFSAALGSFASFSGTLRVTGTQATAVLGVGFDSGPAFAIPAFIPSGGP